MISGARPRGWGLFICSFLAMLGLPCGMQASSSYSVQAQLPCGRWDLTSLTRDQNPHPLYRKRGVLTARSPGKSRTRFAAQLCCFLSVSLGQVIFNNPEPQSTHLKHKITGPA